MDAMTALPRSRALTRVDLDAMPDDGRRYELVDGVLVVTPAPSTAHQSVVVQLVVLLQASAPDASYRVLVAPFDVALDDDTVLQPDVLVARASDLTAQDLPTAPLLAVEVLSPSTRRVDLTLKRSRYAAAGTLAYWVVDPAEPSLTAWELRDSEYAETARVQGQEVFRAKVPYEVSVVPSALLPPA